MPIGVAIAIFSLIFSGGVEIANVEYANAHAPAVHAESFHTNSLSNVQKQSQQD